MGMHVGSGTGATRVKPERPCTVHRRTVAFAPRIHNMIPQYCMPRRVEARAGPFRKSFSTLGRITNLGKIH